MMEVMRPPYGPLHCVHCACDAIGVMSRRARMSSALFILVLSLLDLYNPVLAVFVPF